MALAITYQTAHTDQQFDDGKALFLEYARSLTIDLSFQNFTDELATMGEQYNQPTGVLLLAYQGEHPAGCAGIRALDKETAELKRMYVRPAYRGHRIGKKLLELAIDAAKNLGYKKIRLDTLADMAQAQELYRSFGFYVIPAYRFNPTEGTVYMEKALEEEQQH